jgi:hypothetical protein
VVLLFFSFVVVVIAAIVVIVLAILIAINFAVVVVIVVVVVVVVFVAIVHFKQVLAQDSDPFRAKKLNVLAALEVMTCSDVSCHSFISVSFIHSTACRRLRRCHPGSVFSRLMRISVVCCRGEIVF